MSTTAPSDSAEAGGLPAGLVVRLARAEDVPGICALIGRENRRRADPDEIRRRVDKAPGVVATLGGEVVGVIYGRRFAPDVLEWCNTVVAGALRGRGVGARLVAKGEEEAVRHGYRALVGANSVLHPAANPERCRRARVFWRRMGWREVLATPGRDTVVVLKPLTRA